MSISAIGASPQLYTPKPTTAAPPPAPPAASAAKPAGDSDGDSDKSGVDIKA